MTTMLPVALGLALVKLPQVRGIALEENAAHFRDSVLAPRRPPGQDERDPAR